MKPILFVMGWTMFVVSASWLFISVEPSLPIKKQPPIECWSPFDVYVTWDYTHEDNETILTSNGRMYHVRDCKPYKERK